jgi:hypothetical protein
VYRAPKKRVASTVVHGHFLLFDGWFAPESRIESVEKLDSQGLTECVEFRTSLILGLGSFAPARP